MARKRKPLGAKPRPNDAIAIRAAAAVTERPKSVIESFAEIARDKSIDADKIGKLIEFQRQIMQVNAEAAFNRAYAEMVLEIPEIDRRGAIKNKDGKVQSRYSRFEDIQRVVKPICKQFGFTLSYSTEWPNGPTAPKVIGILTHVDGHARRSEFMAKADNTGSKNDIQALGSAVAYGRRYSTIDLLNIVSKGQDDDGQKSGRVHEPELVEHGAPEPPKRPTPPAGTNAKAGEPITVGQLSKLHRVIANSGRDDQDVKRWIGRRFDVKTLKEIRIADFDRICTAIEAPGDLP